MNALEKAISIIGRPSGLARVCGVFPQAVTRWRKQGFPPVNYVLTIERATNNQVRRHDLRPDIYPSDIFNQPNPAIPASSAQSDQPIGAVCRE
jgi:DNA-binding transcriptional regulator YdaS (Cro superfamily)